MAAVVDDKRQAVDRALRALGESPCTAAEWDLAGLEYENIVAEDADFWAHKIAAARASRPGAAARSGARAAGAVSKPLELPCDPPGWDAYRERVFAAAKPIQQRTLALFGLRAPLAAEDVAPFLEDVRAAERAEGDVLSLTVPTLEADGWTERTLEVRRGYALGEWHAAGHVGFDLAREQRLSRLVQEAAAVSQVTGCAQSQAVLYLLGGVVPYWSAARAHISLTPRLTIHLDVEWPFFDPQDVATLYTAARGALYLWGPVDFAELVEAGRHVRRLELLRFVGSRRARGQSWASILEDWRSIYPDRKHRTVESLRRSYDNARQRAPKSMPVPGAVDFGRWAP